MEWLSLNNGTDEGSTFGILNRGLGPMKLYICGRARAIKRLFNSKNFILPLLLESSASPTPTSSLSSVRPLLIETSSAVQRMLYSLQLPYIC